MHFLPENDTFYDAVNVIHDVITTANPKTFQLPTNNFEVGNTLVHLPVCLRLGLLREDMPPHRLIGRVHRHTC